MIAAVHRRSLAASLRLYAAQTELLTAPRRSGGPELFPSQFQSIQSALAWAAELDSDDDFTAEIPDERLLLAEKALSCAQGMGQIEWSDDIGRALHRIRKALGDRAAEVGIRHEAVLETWAADSPLIAVPPRTMPERDKVPAVFVVGDDLDGIRVGWSAGGEMAFVVLPPKGDDSAA